MESPHILQSAIVWFSDQIAGLLVGSAVVGVFSWYTHKHKMDALRKELATLTPLRNRVEELEPLLERVSELEAGRRVVKPEERDVQHTRESAINGDRDSPLRRLLELALGLNGATNAQFYGKLLAVTGTVTDVMEHSGGFLLSLNRTHGPERLLIHFRDGVEAGWQERLRRGDQVRAYGTLSEYHEDSSEVDVVTLKGSKIELPENP